MKTRTRIVVAKETFRLGLQFVVLQDSWEPGSGKGAVVALAPNGHVAYPEGGPIPNEAIFNLELNEAQSLMDSLYDCGIRPSQAAGSAGAMAAVQAHLHDLRRLVFKDKL